MPEPAHGGFGDAGYPGMHTAPEPMRAPMPAAAAGNVLPLHPQRANRPAMGEALERNPLPPWPAAGQVQGGGANGAPAQGDPRRGARPTMPMQGFPGAAQQPAQSQHLPQPAQTQTRKGGERGPLSEAIPRRMRLEATAGGEVRVAREKIDALVHAQDELPLAANA